MTAPAIYERVCIDLSCNPLRDLFWPHADWWEFPVSCPICGTIDVSRFPVEEYDDPICMECWQRNRHKDYDYWHCFDCDKFLSGFDHMTLQHQGISLFLCREHFDWRKGHETYEGRYDRRYTA